MEDKQSLLGLALEPAVPPPHAPDLTLPPPVINPLMASHHPSPPESSVVPRPLLGHCPPPLPPSSYSFFKTPRAMPPILQAAFFRQWLPSGVPQSLLGPSLPSPFPLELGASVSGSASPQPGKAGLETGPRQGFLMQNSPPGGYEIASDSGSVDGRVSNVSPKNDLLSLPSHQPQMMSAS